MKNPNPYKSLEENILKIGNRPIFFIGAGISIRYINSPNWKQLLENLANKIKINFPFEYFLQKYDSNYERIASELADYYFELAWTDLKKYNEGYYSSKYPKDIFLKIEIAKIIKEIEEEKDYLKNQGLHDEYQLFRKTNPHSIITTNYDTFLEKSFPNSSIIVGQNIISEKSKGNKRKILKIHGSITYPPSIIIDERDYEHFINTKKYLTAKLLTYFLEYPVIIMGYSLNDRNILGILQTISEIDLRDEKINNIWFVNFTKNTFQNLDLLDEKNIVLPNNKTIRVNLLHVRSFTKLYESIIRTNQFPYSISAIANELGYSNWKQIEKFMKEIEKSKNLSDLIYITTFGKRYSDEYYKQIKMLSDVDKLGF